MAGAPGGASAPRALDRWAGEKQSLGRAEGLRDGAPPDGCLPGWSIMKLPLFSLVGLLCGALACGGCATPASQGDALLAGGRVDEALRHLGAATAANPDDAMVRAAHGAALRRAGRPEQAEAELRQALALAPELRRARQELLGLLLDQERLVQAVAAADELARIAPDDPACTPARRQDLLWRAGQQAVETRQATVAIGLLERLLGQAPDRQAAVAPWLVRAHESQAAILEEAERPEEALRSVERALELGGETPALLVSRGRLLLALGRVPEASAAFERGMTLVPDPAEAARQAAALLRKAARPGEAIRFLEQAIQLAGARRRPGDLLLLAGLQLEQKQPGPARESLDLFVQARGGTLEALGEAARLAEENGSGELARGYLEQAAQEAPTDFPRQRALVELLLRQGRRDDGLQRLQRYQTEVGTAEAAFQVAQWYQGQGEYLRALEAYRRALVLAPERILIHLRLAETLQELRRPAERRAALERFVLASPDKVEAHRKVAGLLGDSGETAEALRHLDQAVRLAPQQPTLQADRARIFEAARQPEREAEAWERYVGASPDRVAAASEVAARYRLRGDLERAERFLLLGLQAVPPPEARQELRLQLLDLAEEQEDEVLLQERLSQLLAEGADDEQRARLLERALEHRDDEGGPRLRRLLLEQLVRLQPGRPELLHQLGLVRLLEGDFPGAAAVFDRYEALAADPLEALGAIAAAYGEAGRSDLVGPVLQRMVARGADDPRTLHRVVLLRLEQAGTEDPETLQLLARLLASPPPVEIDLLALARQLEEWRLFPWAEQALRHADARQPLGEQDLRRLGRLLLQQRKVAEARDVLARLAARLAGPGLAKLRLDWGRTCSEVGLADEALRVYTQVLEAGEGPLLQAFQLTVAALLQTGDQARLGPLAARLVAKASPPDEVHAAIARAHAAFGAEDEALASWKRVLVYDPLSQEALGQVAAILLRRGEAERARVLIERQIREAGDPPEAWLSLARRFRRHGAHREAVRSYDEALQRGADPAPTHLERALSLLALGDRPAAQLSLEQALALTSGKAIQDTLMVVGQQLVAVGWDELAIETFRRGVALDRANPKFYAILVELYLRNGRLDLARRAVAEARSNGMNQLFSVALSFEEAGYQQQATTLYRAILETGVDGQVLPAFWRLGLDLVDRGLARNLAPLVQRFLAAVQYSFEGQHLVALLYERAGLHDRALQHLLAGIEGQETDKRWLLVAEAALRAGRPAATLEALLRAAEQGPLPGPAAANAALDLLLARGETALALDLLERLPSSLLRPEERLLARGRLHLRLGDLRQGTASVRRALQRVPAEPERGRLLEAAAETLLDARLYREAVALLEEVRPPLSKEAHQLLLQARLALGDDAASERALEAFLAATPQDAVADLTAAGALLRGGGRYARAAEVLRRALAAARDGEQRRLALYHLLACLHTLGEDAAVAAEARGFVAQSVAPAAALHDVIGELGKLNRWELIGDLLTERPALTRNDLRLLVDELDARLALGQEQRLDPVVEGMVQRAFAAEGDLRSREEIVARVAARLAWSLRPAAAIQRWEQVLALAPAEFAPLERMVVAALDGGDDATLDALVPRFFAAAGERPATWRWLGQKYLAAGRGSRALPLAEQLLAAAPRDPRNQLLQIGALLQAGELARAWEASGQALGVADDPARLRVALGALWLQQGHPFPALDEDGPWLPVAPAPEFARRARELVAPACREQEDGYAAALLVRGLARLQLGELSAAQGDLDDYLRRGGGFSVLLLEPFPFEERDELDLEKLTELLRARGAETADGAARLLLILDAYLAAGQDEPAWRLLERLVLVAPSAEDALERVLQRASLHGRVDFGLRVLDLVGRRFPGTGVGVTLLAELLEKGGRVEDALRAYRRGLAAEPREQVYHNNLAYLLARRGLQLEEALTLVGRARRLGPQGEKFYLDTEGWVLYRLGRYAQAAQRIQAALWQLDRGIGPTVSESLYHLAMVRLALGERGAAVSLLRQAAALDRRGEYGRLAREELRRQESPPR